MHTIQNKYTKYKTKYINAKKEILELKKQIDKLESESKNNQEYKIGYGYGFI